MNIPGIKSINTRLEQLEQNVPITTSFEPSFVMQVHKKEEERKKYSLNRKYVEIKDKYVETINKWVKEPLNELTKVIELTVHFVEEYSPIVGQIFGVVLKGDSKLNFALELIALVANAVTEIINSEFLKNTINHFCLIMSERKTLTAPQPGEKPKKKKGFFKSIRSSIC